MQTWLKTASQSFFRNELVGRTIGLLQLYVLPPLQGYPPFNDFPALYNASSKLTKLIFADTTSLPRIDSFESMMFAFSQLADRILIRNISPYLKTVGVIVKEFGNFDSRGNKELGEIRHFIGNRNNKNFKSLPNVYA